MIGYEGSVLEGSVVPSRGRGEAHRRVIHTTVEGIMITIREYYGFLVIVDRRLIFIYGFHVVCALHFLFIQSLLSSRIMVEMSKINDSLVSECYMCMGVFHHYYHYHCYYIIFNHLVRVRGTGWNGRKSKNKL